MSMLMRDRPKYRRLPYGRWLCSDGTEVLFSRRYKPLWSRSPGAAAVPMVGNEWIQNIVDERWFYDDKNEPWVNPATYSRCLQVLKEFGVSE
jgi:hypothetical protein